MGEPFTLEDLRNEDNPASWQNIDCALQFTGLKDKNGTEIYEGDILEFSDRWEWYRSKYWVDMQFAKNDKELQTLKDKLAAEPMERREVKIPDCYEEFSKGDLHSYWEIIGNIYENPEFIKQ